MANAAACRQMSERVPYADQQDENVDVAHERTRSDVARAFAERVMRLNEERQDNFREAAMHAFDEAKERFRSDDRELPAHGADPLFDAMTAVVDQLDSSPEALRAACEEVAARA